MAGTITSNYPYPFRLPSLTNITPFTYRDGATYLTILEGLSVYITDTFGPSVDGTIAELATAIETAIDEVQRRVDLINNKTGGIDIQRVMLAQNYSLTIDPAYPSNLPITFMFTQDNAGGRTVALPPVVDGVPVINPAANSVSTFTLVPSGNGRWYVSQLPQTRAAFDAAVSALLLPPLEALQEDLSVLTAGVDAETDVLTAGLAAVNSRADDLDTTKARNSTGTYAQRPAPGARRNGDQYHATDTNETYMLVNGTWKVTSPPGLLGAYISTSVIQRLPSSGTDTDWADAPNFSVTFTAGERPVELAISGNIATGYANTTGRVSVWLSGAIRMESKTPITKADNWYSFDRSCILYGLTPGTQYTAQVRVAPDNSTAPDMSYTRLDGNPGDPTVLKVVAL